MRVSLYEKHKIICIKGGKKASSSFFSLFNLIVFSFEFVFGQMTSRPCAASEFTENQFAEFNLKEEKKNDEDTHSNNSNRNANEYGT